MFGPGGTAGASAATQNRSQVDSGIIATLLAASSRPSSRHHRDRPRGTGGGIIAKTPAARAAASLHPESCCVPERSEERARRPLDGGTVGCRHLAPPGPDAIALRRAREVGVDLRPVVAFDH